MEPIDRALRQYRVDTEPSPEDLTRYDHLITRKAAGLRERGSPAMGFSWWVPVAAVAAAAALAVAVWPEGQPAVGPVTGEAPLQLAVNAPEGERVQATEHVSFDVKGEVAVSGTAGAPRLDLTSGNILVSVEPGEGIDLRVHTPDGEVRVLGTVFEVSRDAMGTHVNVQRGKVWVSCADGQTHTLTIDQDALCLPGTPLGMHNRADALMGADDPEGAAKAASAGLGMSPDALTRSELLGLRMDARARAGDTVGALEDARAYLDGAEQSRRTHVLRQAARLSAPEGCDAARPYLEALMADGQGDQEPELMRACGQVGR